MAHERLNALLASFIPLIPLLFQRGAQDIDWGVVTDTKPFAPKYLPPVPELLKDEALINLYNHAYNMDSISGPRWLLGVISQPLGTSHLVADALRAHFQVNVVPSSLLLWVIGLLFLALVSFFDPPDIHTSSPSAMTTSYKASAHVSSTNTYPAGDMSGSAESVKSEVVVDWGGGMDDTVPLPPFGIRLSTHFLLSPIEEEDEVQHHITASPLLTDAADSDVEGVESAVRHPTSIHLSSSLSSQSATHASVRNFSSLDVSVPSTPSRSVEGDIEEQSYPSSGDKVDASSTSTDFVFTIVPPSTSDLDSIMNYDTLPSPRGEATEVLLPSTTSDVVSTASSTQNTLSSGLPSASSAYTLSDVITVEDQLEKVYGRGTSLEAADGVEINNVLVCEPTAIPALDEDPPQPTVQELDGLPSPARSRALSDITEITEPNDSSDSSPGAPRVEWFSGIHGGLASLDHHGLTLQATRGVAKGGTTASTPEVDVESHWSLVGLPSGMEDFLPLSTSTPNLHSTAICPDDAKDSLRSSTGSLQGVPCLGLLGGLVGNLDCVVDAATPEFPAPAVVDLGGSVDDHVSSSFSSAARTGLRNEDDRDGKRFEDTPTALPLAASVADVSSKIQQSQSQAPVTPADADEAAPKKHVSTVLSPTISPSLHPCSPSAAPDTLVALALPTMGPTVTDRDDHLQSPLPALPDQPTPKATHARRANKASTTALRTVNWCSNICR